MEARPPARFARILPLLLAVVLWASPLPAQETGTGGAGGQGGVSYAGTFFEAEEVNPGLPPPAGPLNLATPQALMELFLDAGDSDRYDLAAHALDLSLIPVGDQAVLGPSYAEMLHNVIRRQVLIDWTGLPDRPDGVETRSAQQQDPLVGEPRRGFRIGRLALDGRTVDLRIERIKPESGEPRWLFSAQTVGVTPQLHAAYGPAAFVENLPGWARSDAGDGLAWWEVLVALATIALAAGLFWLVRKAVAGIAVGAATSSWRGFIGTLKNPLALAVAAGFLYFTLRQISYSPAINAVLVPALWVVAALAVGWLVYKALDSGIERGVRWYAARHTNAGIAEQRRLMTQTAVLRRVVLLVLLLVAAGFAIQATGFSSTLGVSILASAGVLSVVIGLALRPVLGNLFAGIQVALAQPAKIGDCVIFAGRWGWVEDITYTYVQIKTWDEKRLIVPVEEFVSETFENWSKLNPSITYDFTIEADHRVDVDAVREHYAKILEARDDYDGASGATTQVISVQRDTVTLRFLCSAADPSDAWTLHCDMREAMHAFLREQDEGRFLPRLRYQRVEGDEPTGEEKALAEALSSRGANGRGKATEDSHRRSEPKGEGQVDSGGDGDGGEEG